MNAKYEIEHHAGDSDDNQKDSISEQEKQPHQIHNGGINPPSFTKRAIAQYCKTRVTELIPRLEVESYAEIYNPFKCLRLLTLRNWGFFFAGFWCWVWDAFGYFSVSMNTGALSKDFDVSVTTITWGITVVLMLRSVGAVFFGYLSDRYGRTIPLAVVMICLSVINLGNGFVHNYHQFLAVRAIFGIFMGGSFGPAAALALEDAPAEAHGILSGIFQQGYAFGYLLVIVFQRAITDNSSHGWRALFWFSAGPSVLFAIWVLYIGETDSFKKHQLAEKSKVYTNGETAGSRFAKNAKEALKNYWLVCIYLVLLMAGFNFASHGSQDLYPTLLSKQLNFNENRSTVTNVVANLGACLGGVVMGHLSSFFGRRFIIILSCIGGGALIYPWAFLKGTAINAGVFWLQFFVQGAWGCVPVHLSELSPPQFRSFVSGIAYQLGNLASSASSTIESTIGEKFPLYDDNGNLREGVYDYGKVMAIFVGCVFGYLLLITFIGPENRGADLSFKEDNDAAEEQKNREKEQV